MTLKRFKCCEKRNIFSCCLFYFFFSFFFLIILFFVLFFLFVDYMRHGALNSELNTTQCIKQCDWNKQMNEWNSIFVNYCTMSEFANKWRFYRWSCQYNVQLFGLLFFHESNRVNNVNFDLIWFDIWHDLILIWLGTKLNWMTEIEHH